MPLEVIAEGDARWDETLAEASAGTYYTREFCTLLLAGSASSAIMFRYEDELGLVFDVTAVQRIDALPFYQALERKFDASPIDLANPQYNGPMVVKARDCEELLRRYRNAVDMFCAENHVVTEFVRMHPLCPTVEALCRVEELIPVSDIFYVDLRQGYSNVRNGYRKGHKSAVRKAEKDGASISFVQPDEEHLSNFERLYSATMQRNMARSVYVYPYRFFEALFQCLKDKAVLVEARAGDTLVSSSIFLRDGKTLWYQYSGSAPELLRTNAHTYAIDRMIQWATDNDCTHFILGGGTDPYDPDDGVRIFKRGFSHEFAKVHQLRKIHNQLRLTTLLAAKEAYNKGIGRAMPSNWFPAYSLD